MKGVNKVFLLGNVGRDPDSRQMTNGDLVCNVSLATSKSWTDKQTGEKKEKTEWHRLVFMGAVAEIVSMYVKKGSQIHVEGELRTREWEKDGVKRYMTEVFVQELSMLSKVDEPQAKQPVTQDDFDDDIPF
tara:strand:- start:537 stop:929 length:393 start_codon:yes stop_codon:yes gene_type:complete